MSLLSLILCSLLIVVVLAIVYLFHSQDSSSKSNSLSGNPLIIGSRDSTVEPVLSYLELGQGSDGCDSGLGHHGGTSGDSSGHGGDCGGGHSSCH